MRRFNRQYAAFLVAALVVLGVGTHFLHGYQLNRKAGVFLAQADRAEKNGQLAQAADHLGYYLSIHDDDADVIARYGLLLAKLARNRDGRTEAFLVLERALKLQPGRKDVGRQVVALALVIGRTPDAIDHAVSLQKSNPQDAELLQLLAECYTAGGQYEKARISFLDAVREAPGQLQSYVSLAHLLRRRLEQPGPADTQVEAMVSRNEKSVHAWLFRAIYYHEYGNETKLTQSVDQAYALAPDDAEVLMVKAIGLNKKAGGEGGRKYLERGIELHPKDARFYVALAEVEMRGNRPAEAARRLRECLKNTPPDPLISWTVADLLLDAGAQTEAKDIVARLRAQNYIAAPVAYLEGRLMLKKGDWCLASERFDHLLPQLVDTPELAKRTNLFLGQCYEQLSNPDQALAAYRRASAADPLWFPPRAGIASASLTLGKVEDALVEYRAIQNTAPEGRLAVARLLILRNLGLPSNERNWGEVETVLHDAEKILPDSVDVPILQAEVLVGQNRPADAQKMLEALDAARQKHAQYWVALAEMAQRMQQPERVLPLLDKGAESLGPVMELQLARARHWSRNPGAAADDGLSKLEKSLSNYPPDEQARLRNALAEAHVRHGRPAEAKRLWTQVAEADGRENSLYVRLLLFDLELKDGDDAVLRRLIGQIRSIEGDDGALWRYCEAARLLRDAKRGDAALDEARGHLSEVAKRRPGWSRVPLLEAAIAEIEGNADEVIRASMAAIDRGEQQPATIRRVVQLLYERRRYVEADQVIRHMPAQTPLSGDLMRLAAEISIRRDDSQRGLELAQMAVPDNSTDYRDQIWLGAMLGATGRKDQAEEHFRKAVVLGAKFPDTWVALIQFLARNGQPEKAGAALRDAEAALPTGMEGRALALAQCYEALGRVDQADAMYQTAVKNQPDTAAVVRAAADYQLRHGRPQAAEPHLRKLMEPAVKATPADTAWARRNLAFSRGMGGTARNLAQALALLDENRRGGKESDDDLRVRAVVLALQPGGRSEAIRLFLDLGRRQPLTPDEQFLLAKLYQMEGDWRASRDRLLGLVSGSNPKPLFLRHYIDSLLQRGDPGEALVWVTKLEQSEPNAPTTVQLKVRTLFKQKKIDQALAAVHAYAATKDAVPVLVAELLDGLGAPAATAAEEAYGRLLIDSNRSGDMLRFADFLARQRRLDEALQLCERAWKVGPPGPVARQTAGVIRAGRASPEQVRRVEAWVARDLGKKPTVDLLMALADLHDYQDRAADATAAYRDVLRLDDGNGEALNNLAWLLAVKLNQAPEALALIDRAIGAGSSAALLDTRAVIYLRLGRPEPALLDLERVIAMTPTGTTYFHQAQAFMAGNNRRAAGDAFRMAQTMKLQPSDLHPAELTAYHRLSAEIGER